MPTAPGYANVGIQITHNASPRPAWITFGVHPSDPSPTSVCAKVSASLSTAGGMQSSLDNEAQYTEIRCAVGQDGGEDLVASLNPAKTGSNSLTSVHVGSAVLVHKRTTRGGRRGRGRLYMPWFMNESSVDEAGIISAGTLVVLQGIFDNWLAALITQGVPMVVLHDPGQTAPGPPNEVTNLVVDRVVGTQRRRLGR